MKEEKNIYEILEIDKYSDIETILKAVDEFLNNDTNIKDYIALRNEFSKVLARTNVAITKSLVDGLYAYDKRCLNEDDFKEKYANYKEKKGNTKNDNEKNGKHKLMRSSIFYKTSKIRAIFNAIKYENDLNKEIKTRKKETDKGYMTLGLDGYKKYKNGKLIDRSYNFAYIKQDDNESFEDIAKKIGIDVNSIDIKQCTSSHEQYYEAFSEYKNIVNISIKGVEPCKKAEEYRIKQDYETEMRKHFICEYETSLDAKSVVSYILDNYPAFKIGKAYNKKGKYLGTNEDQVLSYLFDDNIFMMNKEPDEVITYEINYHSTDKEYDEMVEKGLLPKSDYYMSDLEEYKARSL